MGMTIDKTIEFFNGLECHTPQAKDARDVVIDTMRKHQKIQKIVKQKDYDRFNSHNYYGYFLRVQDIRKVLDNGNDD